MPRGVYKRKPFSEETRKKMSLAKLGEKHPRWKGGIIHKRHMMRLWHNENRKKANEYKRRSRHKLGISKKYKYELGISRTKEYKKRQRQKRKAEYKRGGDLPLSRIQMIYEDNIKKNGTLTCYLCLKPIPFGFDNLEHKTPLSRGGDNKVNNLGVACQKCNYSKGAKTEKEYREGVLNAKRR